MMTNSNFQVVPSAGMWQIIKSNVLFAECQNKKHAVNIAKKLAAKYGTPLVVHSAEILLGDENTRVLRSA